MASALFLDVQKSHALVDKPQLGVSWHLYLFDIMKAPTDSITVIDDTILDWVQSAEQKFHQAGGGCLSADLMAWSTAILGVFGGRSAWF